ncbi:conserved hypothetical protein (plasmid) [Aster yellows witches'-broom phytoplasma AYWB]|uniref:Uncharacterized protein n=1 Tax=Aster yellows witches'-broom phytoplasma (strain AYWB) TaxID=322098 RepID=Q2NID3_AYWBP|nr:hypothetical protein [Aster yellows witches'-broom phytoplasma]ABC65810.1 conserved hypothetical protein [Aster yellows witches'-broom phytoplasma AYWB]
MKKSEINKNTINFFKEMKSKGFKPEDFQRNYYFFEIKDFKAAGFTNDEISFFDYTINELKQKGFTNKQIDELSYYDEYYFGVDENEQNKIIDKLKNNGFTNELLKSIKLIV